jgi:hypothetical protein
MENDFRGASAAWEKSNGTTAYVPKVTILKSMAAKIEQVTPAFLI